MKVIAIVALLCASSLAQAEIYKCHSGGKVIYQNAPCPNGKTIDNPNGEPPSPHDHHKALQRTARERALAEELAKVREAEKREATVTLEVAKSTPPPPRLNRPDAYYDRPDRYYGRGNYTTGTTTSGSAPQR